MTLEEQIREKANSLPKKPSKHLSMRTLLRPHLAALIVGFIAVVGEGAANLLEPWPLKIVLDEVLHAKPNHTWIMEHLHSLLGADKLATLKLACALVIAIALLDARWCGFQLKSEKVRVYAQARRDPPPGSAKVKVDGDCAI